MYFKLVDDLGGIVPFWWAVLEAVKEWFPEPGDSFEYRAFKSAFFGACGLAVDTDFEEGMNEAWEEFKAWENCKLN